jgi:hypothetical protein
VTLPAVARRLAVFAWLGLLQGCVPIPHFEPIAPSIKGLVRAGERPASSVEVTYTHRKSAGAPDCSVTDATTVTDEAGEFSFAEAREFRFFTWMGDPGYQYEVCARSTDQLTLLWTGFDFGILHTPVQISCDLSVPIVADGAGPGNGRCSVQYPRQEK